jgi:hypothetical protein
MKGSVVTREQAVDVVAQRLNVIANFGGTLTREQLLGIRALLTIQERLIHSYQWGWQLAIEGVKCLGVVLIFAIVTVVSNG